MEAYSTRISQHVDYIFQNGDILIVEYTDVGWSPYFPMIAGLVTEIGGLLSHGQYDVSALSFQLML